MGRPVVVFLLLAVALVDFSRGQAGSIISFRDKDVTADEEDGNAEICLTREGTPDQINNEETVYIRGEQVDRDMMMVSSGDSPDPNMATGGEDFGDEPVPILFEPGDEEKCANLSIVQDSIQEIQEEFQVSLLRLAPNGELQRINGSGPLPAFIRGQMGSMIRFRDVSVTVDEEDQKAEICLIRDGTPSQINSKETVYIQGGQVEDDASSGLPNDVDTATSDEDFSDELISVDFESGDKEKCADIPIRQDEEDEEEEEFQVSLLRLNDQGEPQKINGTGSLSVFIRDMDGAVVGDPMFTVPLSLPSNTRAHFNAASVGLCYEVHGIEKGIFNLFSDYCVSLNGLFTLATDPSIGNIISKIGIVAVDDDGYCHQISVSLYDRKVMMDGNRILLHDRHSEAGISIRSVSKDTVRIAVPNCKEKKVVFKVQFGQMEGVEMLKLIVGKGQGLSTESHGMMGQFWNTPADLLPSSESDIYRVMIHSMTSGVREFQGDLHPLTWDFQYKPCLYGGDRQGFPVLEGKYKDYKVSGDIFNTDFTFSQFSSAHCQN